MSNSIIISIIILTSFDFVIFFYGILFIYFIFIIINSINSISLKLLDIDEIISHELDMATCGLGSTNRAKEHEQIARWLMELKERRLKDEPKMLHDLSSS